MKTRIMKTLKTRWFIGAACLIVGAGVVLGIRFFTYKPETVHYHANFAVYINGQREQFKSLKYYEETAAATCTVEPVPEKDNPMSRVHMHGMVSDVIHVEDHLVTWGNFFQVLGWGLGDNYLKTADKIYTPDAQNKLGFMLNGKQLDSVANLVINDQDKLLVSYYGDKSNDQLRAQFSSIQNNALKYDEEQDPAGCSGHKNTTLHDRLVHMF